MKVELIVSGNLYADLTPNKWREGITLSRQRKKWREKVREAWLEAGRPCFYGKVRIQFTFRRGRVVDPDNLFTTIQPLLNSLKTVPGREGMIVDDSARYVELLPIQQVTGKQFRGREDVLIAVELAPGVLPFDEAA